MRETVNVKEMIDFLTENWKEAHRLIEDFGSDDPRARMHIGWCIGMKEMVECLACTPVGLRRDGTVAVGFDAI